MEKFVTYDPIKKVWSGRKVNLIYNAEASVGYIILNVLRQTPGKVMQINHDKNMELTCGEIYTRSIKIANHLINAGYKQGDIVGLIAHNSDNAAPIMFACLTLGLTINPLATTMNVNDMIHIYSMTRPKLIFVDSTVFDTVKEVVDQLKLNARIFTLLGSVEGFEYVDDILTDELDVLQFKYPILNDISSTTAFIMCTSGTSNKPKAVCQSHKSILSISLHLWDDTADLKNENVIFDFTASFWTVSISFMINSVLYGLKRVFTRQPYSPKLLVEVINQHKVTFTFATPSMMQKFVKSSDAAPLITLRTFMFGGTTIQKEIVQKIQSFLPNAKINSIYGMTEGRYLSISFTKQKDGSSGYVSPNTHLKVIDENWKALGPNEIGEICFKSPTMSSHYFGDTPQTADTDGWANSSDLGYIDEEGFVFVIDPIKNVIYNGHHRFPAAEIESIINEIDGVVTSCAVGVYNESMSGDVIAAFVIKDPNNQTVNEEYIEDYVNSRVIDVKRIRAGVYIVDTFPVTVSGKTLKRELKEIAKKCYYENKMKT